MIMTYKDFLNNTKDNKLLATFLYNFCIDFYTEKVNGLCEYVDCNKSKDGCYGCIENLLNKDIQDDLLERRNRL